MAKKKAGATPALELATEAGISFTTHSYEHDSAAQSYGLEAAEKLDLEPGRVFKTLVAAAGTELVVAIVPVDKQLDLKAVATALKVKAVAMAEMALAERATGYVAGGISPLGQKKALRTVIDISAQRYDTMHVSAGRRGLEIELNPDDLQALTGAIFAAISR